MVIESATPVAQSSASIPAAETLEMATTLYANRGGYGYRNTDRGDGDKSEYNRSGYGYRNTGRGDGDKGYNGKKKEDVFGVVNEGDKNDQGSHDLNSVRTNLQALAMKSTYTPYQYRKIMKLLNEERQVEVNMAGISSVFDSLLECDRRRSYDDAMNASNEHNMFSKKGHWIVDSGATCHMTSKSENLDKISRNNKNTGRKPFCDYDIDGFHTPLDVETSDEHAEQTLVPTEHVSENITEEHDDDNIVVLDPRKKSALVIVLVYVDDLLITENDLAPIQETKQVLHLHFKIKDLGELRYFLGIEFCRSEQGIVMNQRKYALELISETGLSGARPSLTPLETNMKLTSADYMQDVHDELFADINKYQRLIGKLLYLTNTRPDIAFSVQCLSQFMQKPTLSHWNAALKVVRYVKTAPGLGILMSSDKQAQLTGFCDADWAACPNTRRSVTGYLLKYGKSLIA
uniref:Reverse transcriptase Ty1/copia-type domain-containing protein n=1 Tax=Solanum lycopersicum TaxID=4081 RepID=A0A3Q7GZI6_SOLLC